MTNIWSASHTLFIFVFFFYFCSRCVHYKKDLHDFVFQESNTGWASTDIIHNFGITIQLKKTFKNPVKTSLRWFSLSKQAQDCVSQKHQKSKQIVEITGTNGLYNLLRLRKKQSRLFYSTWLIFWIGFKLVRGKKDTMFQKNILATFGWSTRLFTKKSM